MSTKDHFDHQGPKYLTNLDWENHGHQRIVAACLVKAAYLLEKDRENRRRGGDRIAPPWWEFFGFELLQRLEDLENSSTSSTIGAVFRLKAAIPPPTSAPTIVIAVRGTHNLHDWGVNMDTLLGDGPGRHYYRIVMSVAEACAGDYGNGSNLWLCGHSLGATVATNVGKAMAMKGSFFTTFLFNPAYILNRVNDIFLSLPDYAIKKAGDIMSEVVSDLVRTVAGDQAAGHAHVQIQEYVEKMMKLPCFGNLNRWDHRVYVNSNDWLCESFIKYFEEKMKGSPVELPEHIASATLVINLDKPGDRLFHFKEAHTITQWWKQGLRVKAKRYVMA